MQPAKTPGVKFLLYVLSLGIFSLGGYLYQGDFYNSTKANLSKNEFSRGVNNALFRDLPDTIH